MRRDDAAGFSQWHALAAHGIRTAVARAFRDAGCGFVAAFAHAAVAPRASMYVGDNAVPGKVGPRAGSTALQIRVHPLLLLAKLAWQVQTAPWLCAWRHH